MLVATRKWVTASKPAGTRTAPSALITGVGSPQPGSKLYHQGPRQPRTPRKRVQRGPNLGHLGALRALWGPSLDFPLKVSNTEARGKSAGAWSHPGAP